MKGITKLFLLVLILGIGLTSCPTRASSVFEVIEENPVIDTKREPAAIGAVNVKVNFRLLNEATEITVPLPGKKTLQIVKKREDKYDKGRIAWYGLVVKDPGSLVLLSITPNALAGKITTGTGNIYGINCLRKDIYQIVEYESKRFEENRNDAIPVPKIIDKPNTAMDCPDPATNIDVMIVYTADAETGAGGQDAMEAFIYECIYVANLSYQNSNINQRLNLVHFEEVTYTETSDANTDLTRLQNTADGYLDNVHTLRNTYSADMVTLLVENMTSYCGIGYMPSTVAHGNLTYAFTVLKRSCAVANLSYPHELGHNMGARHDCTNDSAIGSPYDYNHGYYVSTPADGSGQSWRTVMAYNDCTSGPCNRIPYFSNPSLNYSPTGSASTDAMGTSTVAGNCTADNRQTLNNTGSTISNYICSSPGVHNVWMRDTWEDTGLEPDPNTAGQAMWVSPYIWARNDQDATFVCQFIHQNPIKGQTNWVYVKMINGDSTAASGTLELYYANASVSLTWPSGWTLINNPTVSINANSTTIVEIAWNGLPSEGHYCLLARWVSAADPMTFSETADIGYNTRQNNNIIWRNVNIIEASPDAGEQKAFFTMQNITGKPTGIEFNDQALFPKHAFIETGDIFIVLEKDIFASWVKAGSKGTGIKVVNDKIQIIDNGGSIDNIPLQREQKTMITFSFIRKKNTISDKYNFIVRQYIVIKDDKQQSIRNITGGVSYEIYTYKR
ncbi:MAG: hypothetical protein JXD23_10970 [Spirochaetales bacterium]|nr:hypothetical protein [Spirochaetales bacterium]